jgi:hypothetical protein
MKTLANSFYAADMMRYVFNQIETMTCGGGRGQLSRGKVECLC